MKDVAVECRINALGNYPFRWYPTVSVYQDIQLRSGTLLYSGLSFPTQLEAGEDAKAWCKQLGIGYFFGPAMSGQGTPLNLRSGNTPCAFQDCSGNWRPYVCSGVNW